MYFSQDQFGLNRSEVQGPILIFSIYSIFSVVKIFSELSNYWELSYGTFVLSCLFGAILNNFDHYANDFRVGLFLFFQRYSNIHSNAFVVPISQFLSDEGMLKQHFSYALQTHHSKLLHSSTSSSLPQCKLRLANDLKSHFPK